MSMHEQKITVCLVCVCILLSVVYSGFSMGRPIPKAVQMEFVRAGHDTKTEAIIVELIVPDIKNIYDLTKIELLICNSSDKGQFGVMLNLGDRCNPIPPGNFGVIIDPASDDRSIKNVSSAGGDGQFDTSCPRGTLLNQSASGIANGNLGVSVWIVPKEWAYERYIIKTRTAGKKNRPSEWQKLAAFEYTKNGAIKAAAIGRKIRPIFISMANDGVMPHDEVGSVDLIRYDRQKQDKGVLVKRWPDDTRYQHKYVETARRSIKLSECRDGLISLEPGFYQINHTSVTGIPPSGYYGKSVIFEVEAVEDILDVEIVLAPAI